MSEEKNTKAKDEHQGKEQDPSPQPQPAIAIGTKPQTTNMEVHKHPHHVTHSKKWGEYFLEFLMIFLAVTLGFFAENIRERVTESHREKEFAKQLYLELKEDSVVVSQKVSERKSKEKTMDYIASYLKDSSLDKLSEDFYPALTISLYLINRYAFEPKDGMLSQLRNSGSLRYFKSVHLQKLLGDLSVYISNIRFRNDQEYQFFANPIKPFMVKYFDFDWLTSLRNVNDSVSIADVLYNIEKYNFHAKAVIRNLSGFDRSEAANMVLFYKQMLISTRTLQLSQYLITNHEILQELRDNYKLDRE
jgi:hypothetical protein